MKNKKEIYIIGGGSSLINFDFNKLKNKNTIVVNKSIFYVTNPTYFITLDYSFIEKLRRNNTYEKFKNIDTIKTFVAQMSIEYLKKIDDVITDTRFNLKYNLEDFDIVIESPRIDGISLDITNFRSGLNSGLCALQLAIVMGYKTIYLLGMDLNITKETHFHGGYGESLDRFNKKLITYFDYYKKALADIESIQDIKIYSCSKTSRLNELIQYKEII